MTDDKDPPAIAFVLLERHESFPRGFEPNPTNPLDCIIASNYILAWGLHQMGQALQSKIDKDERKRLVGVLSEALDAAEKWIVMSSNAKGGFVDAVGFDQVDLSSARGIQGKRMNGADLRGLFETTLGHPVTGDNPNEWMSNMTPKERLMIANRLYELAVEAGSADRSPGFEKAMREQMEALDDPDHPIKGFFVTDDSLEEDDEP